MAQSRKFVPQNTEMAATTRLEFYSDQERDILSLAILPRRRSVMDHTAHGFHYCTARDDPDEIVGFEIWDFAYFIPHLYEAGVIPKMEERFDVVGTELRDATLREVLEWAYQYFVLEKRAGMITHLHTGRAVQAAAEERGKYELNRE